MLKSSSNTHESVIFDIETAGIASEELVRAINPPCPEISEVNLLG
ncbi:MAG: hypothetical protein AB3N63_16655 [Puniceicoccaceae bacterium]